MLYVGIDVGKFSHSLCHLSGDGLNKMVWQITNDRCGFEKLKEQFKDVSRKEILIGLEATGHYFLNLYDFLLQLGFSADRIALLNPLQVKSFRNTNLRGAKECGLLRQDSLVMCTHIWRFSKKYEKITIYVYKIAKQRSRRTFKVGITHCQQGN